MKKHLLWLSCSMLSLATPPCANAMGFFASYGDGISKISNDPHLQLDSITYNNYVAQPQTHTNPLVGLGIEHEFAFSKIKPLTLTLGLATYRQRFGSVQGVEHPFANQGDFDTVNYRFNASSTAVLLESKWIYAETSFQPYLLLGAGPSWNRLSDYSESATSNSDAIPNPNGFTNQTTVSLAYEAGLGLQKQFMVDRQHGVSYTAAIDYRYMNFGQAQLGLSPNQTTTEHLQVPRLETQAVVLSLHAAFV